MLSIHDDDNNKNKQGKDNEREDYAEVKQLVKFLQES